MRQGSTRVTIKDVAKRANVSQSTVSLVLNDSPNVSTSTRENVMRIMRELDFKPDALARRFSLRRANSVALIMPPSLNSFDDPYFMHLLMGVVEGLRAAGYKLMLEVADDHFVRRRVWEDLFTHKYVDGLLVATPYLDQDYLQELAAQGHPVMLLNGARPDLPTLNFVGYDDVRCAREATSYLVSLGHRRIGHLAGPENQASALNRLQGYTEALACAGISFRPEDVFACDYKALSAAEAMQSLLARPTEDRPTALFCANDTMAIAAMRVAQQAGLVIPGDLCMVGVDDTGAAEKAVPPLTTFRQDLCVLARTATDHLICTLDGSRSGPVQERLPMTLIERASCAPRELSLSREGKGMPGASGPNIG